MKNGLKCIVCALMVLWLSCAGALAEGRYQFNHPAYAGLVGKKMSLGYVRTKKGGDCVLQVVGENGEVLGQAKVSSDKQYGNISVEITEDMPAGQTVKLVLLQNGEEALQDECILAVDFKTADGLRKVNTEEKKIAITFDTAMGLGKTYQLLDLLDKHGVKCTFFLQGEFAVGNPDAVKAIFDRGHELANHSLTHPDMPDCDESKIYKEITRCNELIENITGQKVTLYRPPSGYYTYRDRAIGRALGCEMILWTFDSHDGFKDASQERVWKRMCENSEPGAIILMHVYGTYTLDILDRYLPMMQQEGYSFVTVTDLMLPGGVIDKDGVQSLPAEM